MPDYRYLLCDLLTDRPIVQLPLEQVSFDRRISVSGSLQATMSAPNPRAAQAARLVQDYCGRSALWVYRDAELWWGGINWTNPAGQDKRSAISLQIAAQTFDSYPAHRILYADRDYDQVDAGVIIPDLWRAIQAERGGDIGVVALDQPIGTLLDRSYNADDLAYVDTMISDVGAVPDGPEHTIDTYVDAATGRRVKRLRLATTLGQQDARIVFGRSGVRGGRVMTWSDNRDATAGGTTFQLRGDGIVSDQLRADDLLGQGWPLLDYVEDRSSVDDDTQLAQQLQALRAANAGAVRTRGYSVQVGDTGWTPNRLGEPVRVKTVDDWHVQGSGSDDFTVRPVGVKVTPPVAGTDETVELLFGDEAA